MLLGTGYAAINSKEINITGTVSAIPAEIGISNFINFSGNSFDVVSDGLNLTISLKEGEEFTTIGEEKSFFFDIGTSKKDYNVNYKMTTTLSNPDFFSISSANGETGTITMDGGLSTFYFTVELIDLPVTEEETSCTITINIELTPTR